MRFRKLTNAAANLDATLITVNNLFAHWIKKINKTKYGTNKQLITSTTPHEIYHYSEAMLKHLPEKALKKFENIIFTAKKL